MNKKSLRKIYKNIFFEETNRKYVDYNKEFNNTAVLNDLQDENAEDNLSSAEVSAEAERIMEEFSKKPTNWADIFRAIENFRNELLSIDKQDSTATESQMALVTPLIAYFVLVLETDVLAKPIDTKIMIDIISKNFKTKDQLKKLTAFYDLMHV